MRASWAPNWPTSHAITVDVNTEANSTHSTQDSILSGPDPTRPWPGWPHTSLRTPPRPPAPDAEASDSTQAFYDRWARLYDRVATLPPIGSWRERAAEALELDPGDTVVEMGCGTGANLPYLRERVGAQGRVVGMDLTGGMVVMARRRVARAGWANVHCCRADATTLPLAREVDAILATFVVGMLPDPGGTVVDWLDRLVPGSRLVLMDAAPTERTLARPLNVPFGLFVWATAPGDHHSGRGPSRDLATKVAAARRSLERSGEDVTTGEFALGFLRGTAGPRPRD
ncbi:MAG: methyltransferase domain-containing protein [Haloarculaceae archaeon]